VGKQYIETNQQLKMETMKIVVNIKASVLHESGVKGPHGGPGGSM